MTNEKKEHRPPLTNRGAAAYLGLTENYIAKLRVTGTGPTYIKIRGRILYSPDDLDDWLNAHKRTSTSEAA